ncbi:UPF0301 protein [Jannaschia pagri]|uniref:UPF0301 protein JANAI62_12930 n=1 Tax=Jannaschia pagri TaxID=2829797 RepID=A0ABQ4NJS5_9RHOB|nr:MULTISPECIES: YqgE/AlgH family protein [unclassified Jannaschia]GIT90838.1 UPF0301 protein [Jannaschia sp. AI_61]GIT94670.1 UPF0301 protein [Jannaschia sp. AI_62]
MPTVTEAAFRKGVILVCAHSATGAMGLLINRPATNMTLRRLLRESGLATPNVAIGVPIHAGGPSDIERPFVLHSSDYRLAHQTMVIADDVRMTPHEAAIQDLGCGRGPKRAFVAMGYCGWGEGALEQEVQDGSWLTMNARANMIFDQPSGERWSRAMEGMGIAPSGLSGLAGHA